MIHQVFPIIRATALAVNSFLIELSAITPEYFTLAGTPSGTLFLLSTRSSFSGSAPFSLDYQRASNTGGFDSGGLHQNLLVLHGFSKLWGPQILSSPCPRLFWDGYSSLELLIIAHTVHEFVSIPRPESRQPRREIEVSEQAITIPGRFVIGDLHETSVNF